MDSQNNEPENSEKSEPGSQIIIISKQTKNRKGLSLRNDDIDPPHNCRSLRTPPFVLRTPTPDADVQDASQERPVFRVRIPPRTNSTPNLTMNTRTPSSSYHTASRVQLTPFTPQSIGDIKTDGDYLNNLTPLWRSEEQHVVRNEPANNFGISSFRAGQDSGVLGLLSRMTSRISSQPLALDSLDEEVLNNFNMEVGAVASRVDMWRQRLEEERTNSVRSYSRSADLGSSPRATPANQSYTLITDEIHHLIQITRDLTNSLFGRFSWGLLGMEDKLMALLQRGSHVVFPMAEILVMNIWRMLRQILDLHEDDTEKGGGAHPVSEAINNAFYAIRSLIQLGKAYRNAHESSDSEYTAEDSRSQLARSLANLDMKH